MFENKIDMVVPVVIVIRGTCTFVTKVRNIEKAGANSAIIIDNITEPRKKVIMSDDGSGAGIRIPSMLISKADGIKIIDFLKTATAEEIDTMSFLADFSLKRQDGKNMVDYDLWYSSTSDVALDFI